MEPTEQKKQIDKLAREVLALSRNTLLVQMRFLDTALSRFEPQQTGSGRIMTDGKVLKYNPKHILRIYRDERNRPTRDYLHLILHCIFHHAFVGPSVDRTCWDLACDIAAEAAIEGLGLPELSCDRAERQKNTLQKLTSEGVILTAEKIYRYYRDRNLSVVALEEIRSNFLADDHDLWYSVRPDDEDNDSGDRKEDTGEESPDDSDSEPEETDEQEESGDGERSDGKGKRAEENMPEDNGDPGDDTADAWDNEPGPSEEEPENEDRSESDDSSQPAGEPEQTDRRGMERQLEEEREDGSPDAAGIRMEGDGSLSDPEAESSGSAGNSPADQNPLTKEDIEEIWNDIARRIKVDLETASRQRGDGTGALMQSLKAVTKEEYDYSDFLRQFAVLGEAIQFNDDEFDYIYYTYGLVKYDNMPLIEPLEYKEVKRIKEFVIAIDTSGSVQGDEVQRFIQKTYNILLEEESFFTKINLHIIQCDSAIQEVQKITSREEFDRYLEAMTLKGFGGTDFRPVFAYVDRMVEEHEFHNLKGVIYFTDGDGIYPERKPDYETAFVFVRDDYEIPQVPVWAIRLMLDPDDI